MLNIIWSDRVRNNEVLRKVDRQKEKNNGMHKEKEGKLIRTNTERRVSKL